MTTVLKDNGQRSMEFSASRLMDFIEKGFEKVKLPEETKSEYAEKVIRLISQRPDIEAKDIRKILIQESTVLANRIKNEDGVVSSETLLNVNWTKMARYIFQQELYKRASKNRFYDSKLMYGDFYGLIKTLTDKRLYTPELLKNYTREDLILAGQMIDPSKDELFDFAGIQALANRYLVKDFDKSIYELPQERFMIAALTLMMEEKKNRMDHVKELYFALSNLYLTLATPTLSNAGRIDGGLSSCYVVTTPDSLRGIYDDNTDIATFSKNGAGLGVYLGKVRGRGSSIKGFHGVGSGVIPWIRQLNNTAVSVDQLGVRPGAIAVYLDIWHKDIVRFLELRLNTGDKAERAHELFTGITIPDEFMRQIEKRGDWYLFDPHEIKDVMGFHLEDFYDNKLLGEKEKPNPTDHAWTYHYQLCIDNQELAKTRVNALDLVKKFEISQLETGTPYMFYRDTVNRNNPNKHAGMIYSSNLCTEISQNMSPSNVEQQEIDWANEKVIITKSIGDLVTCNLSSLVLNNVVRDNVLDRIIAIQMRALDNVISLQTAPVPQAEFTNKKYRAVGAGEQGIAALLADKQIDWDSEEATQYIQELEEEIMLHTIMNSSILGKEKGSYKVFEGSEWQTGEWFEKRKADGHLNNPLWPIVQKMASQYMRNGYLRSPAPTGATSVIAGSTAGIDPIFDVIFMERKKDFMLPLIVPNLNPVTWHYYKPTMKMKKADEGLAHEFAIDHNAARQIFVDQASSFNFYVPQGTSAKKLLSLHVRAWKKGVKTSYYTRTWDKKYEDNCLACSS